MHWLTDGLEDDCFQSSQLFQSLDITQLAQDTVMYSEQKKGITAQFKPAKGSGSRYESAIVQQKCTTPSASPCIFLDLTSTLFSWHPHEALKTQYPAGITDMVYDAADPYNVPYFERFRCSGWPISWVLEQYARDHGPAVAWVYRMLIEHEVEGFVYEPERSQETARYLLHILDRGIDPGLALSSQNFGITFDGYIDWEHIVQALHGQNYSVWVVAQTTERTYNRLCEQYSWLRFFDGVILTQRVQALLDNKHFYDYAIASCNAQIASSLFISSVPKHCAAAQSTGIKIVSRRVAL